MADLGNILSYLAIQASVCVRMGSPFSSRVLICIRDDLERGGPFGGFFDALDGVDVKGLMDDAVPLRLLGGLQYLVLSGADPGLAALYPSAGGSPSDAELARALDAAAAPTATSWPASWPRRRRPTRCAARSAWSAAS